MTFMSGSEQNHQTTEPYLQILQMQLLWIQKDGVYNMIKEIKSFKTQVKSRDFFKSHTYLKEMIKQETQCSLDYKLK